MKDEYWENTFGQLYGHGLKFQTRLNQAWYNNSVVKMLQSKPAEEQKKLRYWIDYGDDDFLTKGNCLLHIALIKKKVPHELRVRGGTHNWTYWRTGITEDSKFIGEDFHQW
jgi:enterochelin esterase-like enzyme